jgi:hypothetical protein
MRGKILKRSILDPMEEDMSGNQKEYHCTAVSLSTDPSNPIDLCTEEAQNKKITSPV